MSCEPQDLITAAHCFAQCLDPASLSAIEVLLLCRWLNNEEE